MEKNDFIIIGAGLSGLFLGRKLSEKGLTFVILEKSRGLGGRIASRRIENVAFDHGAPSLKPHPLLFELLREIGIKDAKLGDMGIYVDDGMTSIPKLMNSNLPIRKECKIVHLQRTENAWELHSELGERFLADKVVLTAPLPQALELLETSNVTIQRKSELKQHHYSKSLIGLIITDQEVILKNSFPEEIHSVVRMKERNLHPSGYVVKASDAFSETHFDAPEADTLLKLSKLFLESVESTATIRHGELKKWKYSQPRSVIPRPWFEAADDLFLIGDSFLYPDARGALLSASEFAENLG